MKILKAVILASLIMINTGCNDVQQKQQPPALQAPQEPAKTFLTVDFQKGKELKYKFVSNRNITIDWGTTKKGKKTTRNIKRSSERVEMVFSYRPVEVNPYGITTIEAKCESVKVSRSGESRNNRDALRSLRGKTYTLKINAAGAVQDHTSLKDLAYEIGEKAFASSTKNRRIKDPDMVRDLIATQWFLWDTISSIPEPAQGISEGQTWESQLSIPLPMLVKPARDVTYTLQQIREEEQEKIAVIKSTYTLGEAIPQRWPLPYEGAFMMRGTFGFFTRYKVVSVKGRGEQLFNIDKGRIEKDRQNYTVDIDMLIPAPLATGDEPKPKTTIRQSITMTLLED